MTSEILDTPYSDPASSRSLAVIMTRLILFGLFIVFVLMATFLNIFMGNEIRFMAKDRANYILRSQADNIANQLWDFESDKVIAVLKNIVEDGNIKAAVVIEEKESGNDVFAEHNWDQVLKGDTILERDIVFTGTSEPKKLGVLKLALDFHLLQEKITRILWTCAGFFLVSFIILSVFSYNIVRRVSQPLTSLSNSLVDADYFTHRIEPPEISSAREIDELFDALIKMQRIMQEQTHDIESQKILLDTVVENLPLGMTAELPDERGVIVINSMYRRLFGIKGDCLDGRPLSQVHNSDDLSELTIMNTEVTRGHCVSERRGLKARKPGGGEFIAHVIKAPVIDKDGHLSMIITLVADETEQYNAHRQILEAKKAAEKANRAKSEFLATMSHELRTPMNSIIGLTDIMLQDEEATPENHEMLVTVRSASSLLLKIVNDILDISKIESGNIVLTSEPFDLQKTVGMIVETTRPLATIKSLNFEFVTESKLPNLAVMGDPTRFSHILTNLLGNAVKFTNKGKVSLRVSYEQEGSDIVYFTCVVSDTGVGIPEDKIDHIFEKFAQADDSITRKFGGTGLGLAIAKQLVELMGGSISVQSVVGKGSAFTVRVPFKLLSENLIASNGHGEKTSSKDRPVEADAKDNIKTSMLVGPGKKEIRGIKVLVAEDQKMNQVVIKKVLGKLGISSFKIADDGALALAAYMQEPDYDLVLMDCHMPVMNGYESAAAIRLFEANGRTGHVPIVAITADAMDGTREKCFQSGMDGYISKPIHMEEFEEILSQWFKVEPSAQSLTTTTGSGLS